LFLYINIDLVPLRWNTFQTSFK